MAKIKELRDQTDEQLVILIEDLDKEVFELRNEMAMNKKIEKPHLIREKKRTKARALTILSEKKKISQKNKEEKMERNNRKRTIEKELVII